MSHERPQGQDEEKISPEEYAMAVERLEEFTKMNADKLYTSEALVRQVGIVARDLLEVSVERGKMEYRDDEERYILHKQNGQDHTEVLFDPIFKELYVEKYYEASTGEDFTLKFPVFFQRGDLLLGEFGNKRRYQRYWNPLRTKSGDLHILFAELLQEGVRDILPLLK